MYIYALTHTIQYNSLRCIWVAYELVPHTVGCMRLPDDSCDRGSQTHDRTHFPHYVIYNTARVWDAISYLSWVLTNRTIAACRRAIARTFHIMSYICNTAWVWDAISYLAVLSHDSPRLACVYETIRASAARRRTTAHTFHIISYVIQLCAYEMLSHTW